MKNKSDKVLILNTTELVILQSAIADYKNSLSDDMISQSHKEVLIEIEEKLNHLANMDN